MDPVKPYIERIEEINDLSDMTNYLLDNDGMNFLLDYPVSFCTANPIVDRDYYTVYLEVSSRIFLTSSDCYINIDETSQTGQSGQISKEVADRYAYYNLPKLGYSNEETKDLLAKCYEYETLLADNMMTIKEFSTLSSADALDNKYSFDELKDLEGNYPLTEILEHFGLDKSNNYTVTQPKYIKAVAKIYSDENLEIMKAYYIVHTAVSSLSFLDRNAFNELKTVDEGFGKAEEETGPVSNDDDNDEDKTLEEKEMSYQIDYFIDRYMDEVRNEIYYATYCSKAQKDGIEEIVSEVLDYYCEMIEGEDWLSDETKQGAIKKMKNMAIHAVYPDEFEDFMGLNFDEDSNLVDKIKKIREFNLYENADLVNMPIDRTMWENQLSPLTVNAYYLAESNSINILPGIIAGDFLFDSDGSKEANMGEIGTIVGHEKTHSIDTYGADYDELGRRQNWWSGVDKNTFSRKTDILKNFYSALSPYPGAVTYNGENVQSEAIADMGGLKGMLGIAKKDSGFDYDIFFRAYVRTWCEKYPYQYVVSAAQGDPHPIDFLRVNVVLQQFDEFNETYGISEGDGMYLPTEDRVIVW